MPGAASVGARAPTWAHPSKRPGDHRPRLSGRVEGDSLECGGGTLADHARHAHRPARLQPLLRTADRGGGHDQHDRSGRPGLWIDRSLIFQGFGNPANRHIPCVEQRAESRSRAMKSACERFRATVAFRLPWNPIEWRDGGTSFANESLLGETWLFGGLHLVRSYR